MDDVSSRAPASHRARLRPLLGTVVTAAGLLLALGVVAPAHAAPETVEQATDEQHSEARVSRLVAQHQNAIEALRRQADQRSREIAGQKIKLAQYGYTGDPDDVRAVLPLVGYALSAEFGLSGPLWEAEHGGQDFSAPSGTTLVAVADGVVTEVADAGPYGLRTILTLADGTEVWYSHQASVMVSTGDRVAVADPIGSVGSTGNSTGPHLHLEVRPDGGSPIDPMQWLRDAGLTP